jgi:hypothetical protein
MFGFGTPELLILSIFVVPIVFAVFVVIDAASRPRQVWEAAGQNQTLWIVLPLALLFACGVGSLIASVVYLAAVRPKLVVAGR